MGKFMFTAFMLVGMVAIVSCMNAKADPAVQTGHSPAGLDIPPEVQF